MPSSLLLHHLVFHSQVQIDFTDSELVELANRSYAYSQLHQVTGVMLYHTGEFMVVFEGAGIVIKEMEQLIRTNVRHRDIQVLARGPVRRRSFSGWLMSFTLSQPDQHVPPAAGYLDLRDPSVLTHLSATPSAHLLEMLRAFIEAVPSSGGQAS
jgi:hypothetical protein